MEDVGGVCVNDRKERKKARQGARLGRSADRYGKYVSTVLTYAYSFTVFASDVIRCKEIAFITIGEYIINILLVENELYYLQYCYYNQLFVLR